MTDSDTLVSKRRAFAALAPSVSEWTSRAVAFSGFILLVEVGYRNWVRYGTLAALREPLAIYLVFLLLMLSRSPAVRRLHGNLSVFVMVCIAALGMRNYGSLAPSAILLPTAFLLAWLVNAGKGVSWAALGVSGVYLSSVVGLVIRGPGIPPLPGADAFPEFWFNTWIIQSLAAFVLIGAFRKVVHALVEQATEARRIADHSRGVFEGLKDAVFVCSADDGSILERNAPALRIRERDPVDWLEEHLADEAALSRSVRCVRCLTTIDGVGFWAEIVSRPFQIGSLRRVVVSVRDIDEKFRYQLEIEALNRELEAMVRSRVRELESIGKREEELARTLADDLNRPLERILRKAKELRSQVSHDRTASNYVDRILWGTGRMENLVDAIMRLSDSQSSSRTPEDVDMESMARECCQEIAASSRSRGVEWEVGALPSCRTDPPMVRQVWFNLISNAFKYSHGVENPKVVGAGSIRDDGIWYAVSDNGPGFDPAQANRLFQPFSRLHTGEVEGLGIGLATVRRILHRLDGAIEAASEPGKGAAFRFRPGPPRYADPDSRSEELPALYQ